MIFFLLNLLKWTFSKASVTVHPCRFSDVTAQFTPGHCCLVLKVILNSNSTSCLSNKGSTFCFLPHILTLDCNCRCTTKGNYVTMHTQNILQVTGGLSRYSVVLYVSFGWRHFDRRSWVDRGKYLLRKAAIYMLAWPARVSSCGLKDS